MSPEGVKLILEQPDAKKMSGRRDMVLLSLMYDSGARVPEMADISVEDFRRSHRQLSRLLARAVKRV
jgi:integrase/recombinase XerD